MSTNYNSNTSDNQSEMLIEVDESDNVIGPIVRKECHNETRKPWHRTTHTYIFNPRGEVLLSQRSMSKDRDPGGWTVSAGGHISWGMSPEQTVVKEVDEELGIQIHEPVLLGKIKNDFGSEREIVYIFGVISEDIPSFNTEEVAQVSYFNLEEIVQDFVSGKFKLSGGAIKSFEYLIETKKAQQFIGQNLR